MMGFLTSHFDQPDLRMPYVCAFQLQHPFRRNTSMGLEREKTAYPALVATHDDRSSTDAVEKIRPSRLMAS
jgi:hypothetical protein